ncbi:amidase family protein [Streptosporangium amethystogenes subsp. fukuiense]|uniref:amidase family protein n=1 Tax=Streptosporangium amethystogenes TaxID=2002 RepID=UPI0036137EEC
MPRRHAATFGQTLLRQAVPIGGQMHYLTATEMLELLRTRQVSAVELLEAHLRRIEEVNPAVNAIVTLTAERARREAEEADRDLARGHWRGPLHGLPVAHKDLADTAGIRTTYGSRSQLLPLPLHLLLLH